MSNFSGSDDFRSCVIDDILKQIVDEVEHKNSCSVEIENSVTLNADNTLETKLPKYVNDTKNRLGNRKSRYRRKNKWKPYWKLTWDERRKLEERDSRRAEEFRKRMLASGLTGAPYNTTQFLMEDYNLEEPDYESIIHDLKLREEGNDSDYYYSSEQGEDYLQREFSETYDSIHDDYIKSMSKPELVRELMRLEEVVENAEDSLKELMYQKKLRAENPDLDVEAELEKIQVFQDEIEKLKAENRLIRARNTVLQNELVEMKQCESSGI